MTLPTIKKDYPVASASGLGRVFYGGGSTVYYSPVVENIRDLGRCYQVNDPTSDTQSDLLDSDGGVIQIQDISRIIDIVAFRNGVVVFADTGIWYISGTESVFKATSFQSVRLSRDILSNKGSVAELESSLFFCGETGAHVIAPNQYGILEVSNITDSTIQTKYQELIADGVYAMEHNPKKKEVWIIFRNTGCLVFDLRTKGWYPQERDSSDVRVVDLNYFNDQMYFVNFEYTSLRSFKYNWATTTESTFKDFGVDQVAYITTGWETLGKFSHKKASTYGTFFFKKTETEITGYDDGYVFDYPSSCLMQARWDFDNSNAYKKWSPSSQLYNPMKRGFIPLTDYPFTFDTGEEFITKKVKIRGNGKAVQFHFEAEPEKDLQLLGYSVEYSMRGRQ